MLSKFSSTECDIDTDKGTINDEIWITESCDFVVPYTGTYEVLTIDGGTGGICCDRGTSVDISAGSNGAYKIGLVYLIKDTIIPVTIGAGGIGVTSNSLVSQAVGTQTLFGDYEFYGSVFNRDLISIRYNGNTIGRIGFCGKGIGGADRWAANPSNVYGAGGAAYFDATPTYRATNGVNGAIRLRFHNPNK